MMTAACVVGDDSPYIILVIVIIGGNSPYIIIVIVSLTYGLP